MNHIGIHALVWAEGWSELGATCSLGLSFEADVSSEDEENRRRGEEVLRAAVRTAAQLGSAFLGGVIYSAMGKYLSPPTRRGRANAVETLGRVAAYAAAEGVTIGVEPVNRYESNLLNTAEEALAFVDEVGAPNVSVQLDSYQHDGHHAIRLHRRECIHDVAATREDAR